MSILTLEIHKIKNIQQAKIELPVEKGIYCFAGANGCGKSTVMSCLAQSIFSNSLSRLWHDGVAQDSYVKLSHDGKETAWTFDVSTGGWISKSNYDKNVHFNGIYEGSLFYGTRFADSVFVDSLLANGKIKSSDIVVADDYVKDKMSYILHGDYKHYRTLKRIQNRIIAEKLRIKNMPYFCEFDSHLISQYRMSSGECLLVSLLHFIFNSVVRRSLPPKEPILMIVDEIELALHPIAVARLLDLLSELIKEHDNLTVVLTSHSPEVINKIDPQNLYMLELIDAELRVTNPCYPSYAIRDVYMHSGFDYVILVEDKLAKFIVEKSLRKSGANTSCLINVLPVGGWENVLLLQTEISSNHVFGIGTKIFSILDGDVEEKVKKSVTYKNLRKEFLPVPSIEKYLLKVIENNLPEKKEINDLFFTVESLDCILETNQKTYDPDGKALYRKLKSNLESRGMSEDSFIKELYPVIEKYNGDKIRHFEDILKQFLKS